MADGFHLGADGGELALTFDGVTLTYRELQLRIDRLTRSADSPADLVDLDVVDTLTAVFAAARDGRPVLLRTPGSDPVDLAGLPPKSFLVAMTSGTAGRPRAVVRTAESWSASFRPLADLAGLSGLDTVLLTGPLHSTLHLFAAVHTLWLGAHLTDDPTEASAAHVVPAVLDQMLGDLPGRLRTVVVAGAPLPPALERRALDRRLRLIEYYGAAELSFVAARVAPAPMTPFPGVDVRGVDGQLWARSPYLALGRIGSVEDLQRSEDGFVTVGDLGELTADGAIVVRGRGDAAVTTGGHTVVVEDVESILAAVPGVDEVAVIGTPHDRLGQVLTAVLVLHNGFELQQIKAAARKLLAGPALPRRWQVVRELPRTANGKIARGRLADSVT